MGKQSNGANIMGATHDFRGAIGTKSKRRLALLSAASTFACAMSMVVTVAPAQAQNVWEGDVDADWFNAANWSDGTLPTATDNVNMNEAGAPNDAVIDGAVAQAQLMRIGTTGSEPTGSLTIQNIGQLNSGHVYVGDIPGTDYQVLVTNGGTWQSNGIIYIGDEGTGKLTVNGGGTVTSADARLGLASGSNGSATVTGAGSLWDAGEDLHVGSTGNGTLNVLNNAEVRAEYLTIAIGAASDSAVYLDGSGTEINLTDYVEVGDNGTGTLEISNRATLNSGSTSTIGVSGSGNGTVTLYDSGIWNQSGTLVIGGAGTGTLGILDNSDVDVTGPAILAQSNGGTGDVTVEGIFDVGAYISVGQSGLGTLTIENGGAVTSQYGIIADNADANGSSVTVDGAGSSWDANDALYIGAGGSGSLAILNGGFAEADQVEIGEGGTTGSLTGSLLIDGAGSLFIANSYLMAGTDGVGNVTVQNGGALTSIQSFVGQFPDGVGVVSVDGTGSAWDAGQAYIGNFGTGTVNVTNNGQVLSTVTQLGRDAGSSGTVLIDGADSFWDASIFYVGDVGNGYLTVQNGGALTSSSGEVANSATSVSTVLVDGTGSLWDVSGSLNIGGEGNATVTVSNGATLEATRAHLAQELGSISDVTVTGAGSTLSVTSGTVGLYVGEDGTATLTVSDGGSVQTYSGVAHIGAGTEPAGSGTVTISGSGSNWTSSGRIYLGSTNYGELTLTDGGTLIADEMIMAASVDVEGVLNIGAAAGDSAAAAGALDIGSMALSTGDSTIVFNHTDTAYDFDMFLASAGMGGHRIEHLAGVTDFGGDWSAYNGVTTVSGGTLLVNGALGGIITATDGVLGGSGNLAFVTVASDGMLAPGNSIGTMNVVNLTFNAGSLYEVELNDGGNVAGVNNDYVNATGTVTINGGTVNVTPENGTDDGTTYVPGTVYTIASAGGGVTGAFDSVTDDYSFINFALSYDANNVFLTSSLADLCLDGFTDNQCATANAVETLGTGTLLTAISNLTTGGAGAFDLLSGEIYASEMTNLLEDSRLPREAVADRLGIAFGMAAPEVQEGIGFWTEGLGSWGKWRGDNNVAGLDSDLAGVMLGADAAVGENIRLGLIAGYSHDDFDMDERSSDGKSDSYTAGLYAGGVSGDFGFAGGLAYSWHDIETDRVVAFTGFTDSLSSTRDAETVQGWAEVNYGIGSGPVRFTPYLGLAYVDLSLDGFTENGGAAALTAGKQSANATFTTLGSRVESPLGLGGIDGVVHGSLGWRHAFGDAPDVDLAFASGSSSFDVNGLPLAEDIAIMEFGVDAKVGETSFLGFDYRGHYGSAMEDHSANVSLNIRF